MWGNHKGRCSNRAVTTQNGHDTGRSGFYTQERTAQRGEGRWPLGEAQGWVTENSREDERGTSNSLSSLLSVPAGAPHHTSPQRSQSITDVTPTGQPTSQRAGCTRVGRRCGRCTTYETQDSFDCLRRWGDAEMTPFFALCFTVAIIYAFFNSGE